MTHSTETDMGGEWIGGGWCVRANFKTRLDRAHRKLSKYIIIYLHYKTALKEPITYNNIFATADAKLGDALRKSTLRYFQNCTYKSTYWRI